MKQVLFLFVLVFFLPLTASSQRTAGPPIPYEDNGACPGECCTYREWIAKTLIGLRADRRSNSPVTYTVRKGEKVTAITGVVITTRPGQARILKPTTIEGIPARTGDTFYLLTPHGEGWGTVWYKGRFLEAQLFGVPWPAVKYLSEPQTVWWVQIKNRKGQMGWSNQTASFSCKDNCGYDCPTSAVETMEQENAAGQRRTQRSTFSPRAGEYHATVDQNEATFTIPLVSRQKYQWCPGGLQYAWTIKVKANNQEFEFGYFMFTAQGAAPCGEGNLQKLLSEGQFSLFRHSDQSDSLITGVTEEGRLATYEDNYSDDFLAEKTVVSGLPSQNKLILKVSGIRTLQFLFANRPKYVTFETRTFEKTQSVTVPVTYTANHPSAINSSPQRRVIKTQTQTTCPTLDEAKDLINELIPDDAIRYQLGEAVTYKPIESLAEVKQNFPLAYLFYQSGFLRLEERGYVFQFITDQGRRLNAQYPAGFPLGTKSLTSVNKVSCKGNKLRVEVTYRVNPTQATLDMLGRDIYAIRGFSEPWKVGIEFTYINGNWELPDNLYLSPNNEFNVITSKYVDGTNRTRLRDRINLEQTVTGFYWPLGKSRYVPSHCGTWLGRDSDHNGCYDKGLYHLGVDMVANVNDPVYAIADGEIIGTSTDGEGNAAAFIKHNLRDNTEFVAVYGHIRISPDVLTSKQVKAGVKFASIGAYSGGSHLHFAIHPVITTQFTREVRDASGQIFKRGWGRSSNYFWPDTNGFVEPVSWITSQRSNLHGATVSESSLGDWPDFTFDCSPSQIQISQGEHAVYNIHAEPLHGFAGRVEITVQDSSSTVLLQDRRRLPPAFNFPLDIGTNSSNPLGQYKLFVMGVSDTRSSNSHGTIRHSCEVEFKINSPAQKED